MKLFLILVFGILVLTNTRPSTRVVKPIENENKDNNDLDKVTQAKESKNMRIKENKTSDENNNNKREISNEIDKVTQVKELKNMRINDKKNIENNEQTITSTPNY